MSIYLVHSLLSRSSSGLFLAAGLLQGLNTTVGIFQALSIVICFGGFIAALGAALITHNLGAAKVPIIICAIGGLAWVIITSLFTAGGVNVNISPSTNIN
jgi:hypothetical protein